MPSTRKTDWLDKLSLPGDIKGLDAEQLKELAAEIRARVIEVTSNNGGHIGPNLGVVELTIALHRIFSTPKDRFVFDVAHQGYVHKLLTGRHLKGFDKIRQTGGLSGFLNRSESEHDSFGAGHAGTCLSAALGMASARDIKGTDEHVVAVVGDAALTCGISLEALNNITQATEKMIVVLNDNEWSIAKNVGAIPKYLSELITNPVYNRLHHDLEGFLKKLPGGNQMLRFGHKVKKETKDFFVPSSLFEKLGLRYLGPIDGHDLEMLEKYLTFAKDSPDSVILHVITEKGHGYDVAISQPERFHGTSPFDPLTGKAKTNGHVAPISYQDNFGKQMVKLARKDKRVVGITAAMPSGTGLNHLQKAVPEQFFDVGIAEEHATIFAAGLATQGLRPVVAIYSTFLQRAYDPIIHDICLQKLPVVFCMDRAGLSPNDGPTHHGLFDLSYLRCIPGAIVMQPKDEDEQLDMLETALESGQACFIRWPRGSAEGVPVKEQAQCLPIGKAEILRKGKDIQFWALGPWLKSAHALAQRLESECGLSVGVVNPRFIKPLDKDLLLEQAEQARLVVSFEDNVRTAGFGSGMMETLADADVNCKLLRIAWPDAFVEHGSSVAILREENGLDDESIFKDILKALSLPATNALG